MIYQAGSPVDWLEKNRHLWENLDCDVFSNEFIEIGVTMQFENVLGWSMDRMALGRFVFDLIGKIRRSEYE